MRGELLIGRCVGATFVVGLALIAGCRGGTSVTPEPRPASAVPAESPPVTPSQASPQPRHERETLPTPADDSTGCIVDPPGPCGQRWWSDLDEPPLVYEYTYEPGSRTGRQQGWAGVWAPRGFPVAGGFRLVEERVRREDSTNPPTVRRLTYDENGFVVREESWHGSTLAHVAQYQNDAQGNLVERRSAAQEPGARERLERHVLELDEAGRVVRDELWAEPDGVLPGYSSPGFSLRHWTVYRYDARGRVLGWSEHDANGVTYDRAYELDDHGWFVRVAMTWSNGRTTEEVYQRFYDDCGNLVRTDQLRDDGSVSDRWTYGFDCWQGAPPGP